MSEELYFPRVKNLPEEERIPFELWLQGQTRPLCDISLPREEWDWYYPWDYEQWKKGMPCTD